MIAYFARRREIASRTFSMKTGRATPDGRPRQSTVGLYELRADRVGACSLLPLDLEMFDQFWQSRAPS